MAKGLPQDQSFRAYTSGSGNKTQKVYLSVSESGMSLTDVFGGDANYPGGLHIFAESLDLKGKFVANVTKPGSVTISTHALSVSSSGEEAPEISAPGVDGENNVSVRASAAIDGKDAPALAIYIGKCDEYTSKHLKISAKGGHGGDNKALPGTKGTEGDGGRGGAGGLIQIIAYTDLLEISQTVSALRTRLISFVKTSGVSHAGALPTTHPFYSATKDMYARVLELPKGDNATIVANSMKAVNTLLDANKDTTYDDLANALFSAVTILNKYCEGIQGGLKSHAENDGGSGGDAFVNASGGKLGSTGKDGENGLPVAPIVLEDREDVANIKALRKQTRVFVHPEQCKMLFDRAMTFWYFGYRLEAMERLSRIISRTAFLPLQESDPLYKAYKEQETDLHCPDSINKLTEIRDRAIAQYAVLLSDTLDYYGRSPRWVPRLSFSEYKEAIREAIAIHRRLEESQTKYAKAKDDKDKALAVVRGMKSEAKKKIEGIDEELKGLVDDAVASRSSVLASASPIEHAQTAFLNEFESFSKKVQDSHQINTKEVLEGAKSIYDNPKDKEAVAKTLYSMGKNYLSNVINDEGEAVEKDKLIKELRKDAGDALKLLTLDNTVRASDGQLSTLAIVPEIVSEEKKLKEKLDQFKQSPFAGAAEDLKKSFKKFTDLIVKRNDDVASYNATLLTIASNLEKKRQAQELGILADKQNVVDPDLNQIASYVQDIYEHSRSIVLRYFNEAQRALTFKTLEKAPDLLAVADKNIEIHDMPLSITSDVLDNMYNNLESSFRKILEKKSNATSEFGNDGSHKAGKRCVLPTELLERLKKDKKVTLTIPPVSPNEPIGPLNKDFNGDADVRVYYVRFYLDGLKVRQGSEGVLRTHITHGGSEVIVSQDGRQHHFEHARLRTSHSYRVRDGQNGVEVDNGKLSEKSVDPKTDLTFALTGPFTSWTIDISKSDETLDFSGVTKGYMVFTGSSYTLNPMSKQ